MSSAAATTSQQQPTPPTSGTATPQPAPAAAAGRSYASAANRKSLGASANGGRSGPTIINGNAAVSSPTNAQTHVRKPSVTISAAGTSGQMPNGGPVAGQTPTGTSQIQFGSVDSTSNIAPTNMAQQDSASLSVGTPGNPRVASPSNSPSPIPQPALPSGGNRPPSSLHGQTNSVSFGGFAAEGTERRPSVPGGTPTLPSAHLRRESSHSQHNEMNMGPGAGRGGYSTGGRGRGFNSSYGQGPPPHSPGARFASLPPSAPRAPGNAPMGQQFAPNQRGGNFPQGFPSPHQAGRSPHLASVQPVPHQQGQMPMQSPGMVPGAYYGPPQGQHMQGYGQYDPAYYSQQQYSVPPGGMYMPQNGYMGPGPNSPRPPFQAQHPGYPQGQYAPQPQPMSRQGSTVSTDRPGSTLGQPPQTPMTPSAGHQHTSSRGANSPASKSSAFQKPAKKVSSAIKITNPNTGEALTFDKAPASPAPSATSKAPESAPTPPPRTPSSQHNRQESKAAKTSEEVKNDLREQIQAKIKADQEAAQKVKDDEEAKKRKEQEDAEQAVREKAEAEKAAREAEEEKFKAAAREAEEARLSQERAIEAEKAKAAQQEAVEKKIQEEKEKTSAAAAAAAETASSSKPASSDEPKEPAMPDMDAADEVWDAYEKELAAYEEAKEKAYAKKKAEKKAEEERAAAEKNAKLDEELKKQEAEAERLEAEKEKKREAGQASGSTEAFAALKKSENAFRATETATEVLPEHGSGANTPSGTETPKSDASSMPPPASRIGSKPKPAALKLETQKQVEAAQPSAALQSLRSARRLAHVSPNLYPEGIQSPNPALNTNAKGSFRYDKEFLMQFQKVFTEKPSETWTEKLKETVGDMDAPPQSARNRQSMGGSGRTPSTRGFPQTMGTFGNGPIGALRPGTTSEQRFAASSGRTPAAGNVLRYDPGKGNPMGNPMGIFSNGGRQPSNMMARGPSNQGGSRAGGGSRRGRDGGPGGKKADASMPLTAGMDLKPIQVSETGWKPQSVGRNNASGPPPGGENGYLAPDVVQRKVKSALNKMTPTTFEKISGQILEIVMQSKKETDGRTLRQVIQLTFEKATDEAHWAEMYAQFCGKMLQNMTSDIRDETIPKDKNGQVISGSTLFRKYLLNRCQQDFEQGWKSKLPDKPEDGGTGGEAAMLSDEYYIAAAAKRRGLGLVRFIGELFKLHMLTARIMHMCVQRLVDFEGMPDEAEVESLTSLLRTIGAPLDALDDKSRTMMNAYFDRIHAMVTTEGLPSRLRFMLMDIIDLRKANWQDKSSKNKGPATIDQVRAEAAQQQREADAKAAAEQQQRRGGGGGRPGVGRGDARNFSGGPPPDFQNNRVNTDDLRRLTKGGSTRSSGAQGPMGPTSMFNTARGSNKRSSMAPGGIFAKGATDDSAGSSRTATPPIKGEAPKPAAGANAFSALAGLDSNEGNDTTSPPASVAALSPPMQKRTLPDRSKSPEKGNDSAGTGA